MAGDDDRDAAAEDADDGYGMDGAGDGSGDAGTLSERLKRLKLREARDADPAAAERAMASKATLSERMREILVQDAEDAVPGAPARVQAAGTPPSPSAPAPAADDEARGFAQRLRTIQREERVDTGPSPARPPPRQLLQWFVGRAHQEEGRGAVTAIPGFDPETWEELEFYAIEPPYSFVRILHNKATGEHLYEAIEPQLSRDERDILVFVEDALVRGLNVDPTSLKAEQREQYLIAAVRQILRDYRIRIDRI